MSKFRNDCENFIEYEKYSAAPVHDKYGLRYVVIDTETGKPNKALKAFATQDEADIKAADINDRITLIPAELLERRNFSDTLCRYALGSFTASYDRSLKLWVVTLEDREGNQIGLAEYFNNKEDYSTVAVKRRNEVFSRRVKRLNKGSEYSD